MLPARCSRGVARSVDTRRVHTRRAAPRCVALRVRVQGPGGSYRRTCCRAERRPATSAKPLGLVGPAAAAAAVASSLRPGRMRRPRRRFAPRLAASCSLAGANVSSSERPRSHLLALTSRVGDAGPPDPLASAPSGLSSSCSSSLLLRRYSAARAAAAAAAAARPAGSGFRVTPPPALLVVACGRSAAPPELLAVWRASTPAHAWGSGLGWGSAPVSLLFGSRSTGPDAANAGIGGVGVHSSKRATRTHACAGPRARADLPRSWRSCGATAPGR